MCLSSVLLSGESNTLEGTEGIGPTLSKALDAEASNAVLQIEFANAFNIRQQCSRQ
jgi:hypothetical protein